MTVIDLGGTGPNGVPTPRVEALETCTGIWEFDHDRRRFRRLPSGVGPMFATGAEWEHFSRLELDPDGRGFSVVLNDPGTRFLRAVRHGEVCPSCVPVEG